MSAANETQRLTISATASTATAFSLPFSPYRIGLSIPFASDTQAQAQTQAEPRPVKESLTDAAEQQPGWGEESYAGSSIAGNPYADDTGMERTGGQVGEILDEEALRHLWPPAAPATRLAGEVEYEGEVRVLPFVPMQEQDEEEAEVEGAEGEIRGWQAGHGVAYGNYGQHGHSYPNHHGHHGHHNHHNHHDSAWERDRNTVGALLVRLGLLSPPHRAIHAHSGSGSSRSPCPMRALALARAQAHAQAEAEERALLGVDTEAAAGQGAEERDAEELFAELKEALGRNGEDHAARMGLSFIGGPDKVRALADRFRGRLHPSFENQFDRRPVHVYSSGESESSAGARGLSLAAHNDDGSAFPGMEIDREHLHRHHHGLHPYNQHHARTFHHRLRRALLALHPTEALAMAFVVGAGIGAVIHAFGVLVVLALGRLGLVRFAGGRRRRGGRRVRCARERRREGANEDGGEVREREERWVDEKQVQVLSVDKEETLLGEREGEVLPPYDVTKSATGRV